mmetsp:Transcript_29287/g.93791  ORF Transcript_29287/g.93791 Transcript_29287/m.93791 type:complete len:252 (-) Transcript_29287:119-874(-)
MSGFSLGFVSSSARRASSSHRARPRDSRGRHCSSGGQATSSSMRTASCSLSAGSAQPASARPITQTPRCTRSRSRASSCSSAGWRFIRSRVTPLSSLRRRPSAPTCSRWMLKRRRRRRRRCLRAGVTAARGCWTSTAQSYACGAATFSRNGASRARSRSRRSTRCSKRQSAYAMPTRGRCRAKPRSSSSRRNLHCSSSAQATACGRGCCASGVPTCSPSTHAAGATRMRAGVAAALAPAALRRRPRRMVTS